MDLVARQSESVAPGALGSEQAVGLVHEDRVIDGHGEVDVARMPRALGLVQVACAASAQDQSESIDPSIHLSVDLSIHRASASFSNPDGALGIGAILQSIAPRSQRRIIQTAGHRIEEAVKGAVVLDPLNRHGPDLIL